MKPVQVVSKDEGDEEIKINKSRSWKSRTNRESSAESVPAKSQPLNVSLGDCLACSGCITSAEAMLIAEQSHEKVLRVLEDKVRDHFSL